MLESAILELANVELAIEITIDAIDENDLEKASRAASLLELAFKTTRDKIKTAFYKNQPRRNKKPQPAAVPFDDEN